MNKRFFLFERLDRGVKLLGPGSCSLGFVRSMCETAVGLGRDVFVYEGDENFEAGKTYKISGSIPLEQET